MRLTEDIREGIKTYEKRKRFYDAYFQNKARILCADIIKNVIKPTEDNPLNAYPLSVDTKDYRLLEIAVVGRKLTAKVTKRFPMDLKKKQTITIDKNISKEIDWCKLLRYLLLLQPTYFVTITTDTEQTEIREALAHIGVIPTIDKNSVVFQCATKGYAKQRIKKLTETLGHKVAYEVKETWV